MMSEGSSRDMFYRSVLQQAQSFVMMFVLIQPLCLRQFAYKLEATGLGQRSELALR